jgi:hypothetical protein
LRYSIAHAAKGYGVKKPKTHPNPMKQSKINKLNKPYKEKDNPNDPLTKVPHLGDFKREGKI